MAEAAYVTSDPKDTLDLAEAKILAIAAHRLTDSTRPVYDGLDGLIIAMEQAQARGSGITGLPTGLADLDNLLSGLQPSTLNVLGARPSMGKSALALNIATSVARSGNAVLFFSLEMGHRELTERALSATAGVDLSAMVS